MKRHAGWMAAAVAAAATILTVGTAPAFAAEKAVPSSDSWQYFEAVESGNFPVQDQKNPVRKGDADRGDGFERVDLGGISYRIGLDTF